MIQAPTPANEKERLRSLKKLDILDSPPEERFNRITRTAKAFFNVKICTLSMIDANRQWFKGCLGLDAKQTDRGISFCAHAIMQDTILVIEDAKKDRRFCDNPLVTNPPKIRFYAGMPLKGPGAHNVGTLCIIDPKPRKFTKENEQQLQDLAKWAEMELNSKELGTAMSELTKSREELMTANKKMIQREEAIKMLKDQLESLHKKLVE